MNNLEIIQGDAADKLDECCKTILRIPEIAARVLLISVPAFRGIPLDGIMSLLPVEGDLVVLADGDKRKMRYDTYYRCLRPDGRPLRVNTEVQGNVARDNTLVNRGLATMSLMLVDESVNVIRAQKYERLTDMCSVWICPDAAHDMVEHAGLVTDDGKSYFNDGAYGLMRLCFIFMEKGGSDQTMDRSIAKGDKVLEEALSCLWAVFSTKYNQAEKKKILRDRYGLSSFAVQESVKMCTYSQMIRNSSFEEGEARGEARGFARGEASGFARGEVSGEVKGTRKTLIRQYLNGYCPLEIAASECSVTVPEFLSLVDKYRNGDF